MRRNITALIFTFLISGFMSEAQELPNVVPPAPEAASLGKYVDMPMNYASGLPQISIPMFQAKSRDITVPVSLSYHAGGIKVEEIASRAGLGWNLQVGGSVTRSVRGLADDAANGWLSASSSVEDFKNAPSDPALAGNKRHLMQAVLDGINDYEPDIFNFSYPGGGGKFFFDSQGNIVQVTGSDHEITIQNGGNLSGIGGFIITDPNGYRYYFGRFGDETARDEMGYTQSLSIDEPSEYGTPLPAEQAREYYSSWYLIRIESPVSNAIVHFSYITQYNYSINRGGQTHRFNFSHPDAAVAEASICAPPNPFSTTYSRSDSWEMLISEIDFEHGKIVFEYDETNRLDLPGSRALDKVVLLGEGGTKVFRTFDLVQDYWQSTDHATIGNPFSVPGEHFSHRLYLKEVIETGENSSELKSYKFDYNVGEGMPSRLSYQQDIWGFFNGAFNNEHMLPTRYSGLANVPTPTNEAVILNNGADRRSNFQKAKTYSLNSITYPTGGKAYFDYEANGVQLLNADVFYSNSFYEVDSDILANYQYSAGANEQEFEFTIDGSHLEGMVNFKYEVTGDCVEEVDANIEDAQETPSCGIDALLTGITDPSYTFLLSQAQNAHIRLAPGTYKLTVKANGPTATTQANAQLTSFQNASPYKERGEFAVGGLRVLRTRMDDTFGNQIIREYSYADPKENRPSGILSNHAYSFLEKGVPYCNESELALTDQATSFSVIPTAGVGSGHITYTKVLETQLPDDGTPLAPQSSADFIKGYTSYEYEFYHDVPHSASGVFPFAPYKQFDWRRGNLNTQSHYEKKGGQLRQISLDSTVWDYGTAQVSPMYTEVEAIKVNKRGPYPTYAYYGVVGGVARVKQKINKNIQINGAITEVTDFEYNKSHIRSDKTVVTHSDGTKIITKVKYSDDIFGDELSNDEKLVLSQMADKNVLSPVLTETFYNDESTPIVKSLTVFGNETAGFLPVASRIWNNDINDFEERLVYTYTDDGNYKHLIKDGGQQVAYVWNYQAGYIGNTRATARVTNVSSAKDIAYTSFEATGGGNWEYEGTVLTSTNLPSGDRYYVLSSGVITKNELDINKDYILSFWAKKATVKAGGGTPQPITVTHSETLSEGQFENQYEWKYYEYKVSGTESVSISGDAQIDELRFRPKGSQMTIYTYQLLRGIRSIGTPNNTFTHYFYDDHGRLRFIKDQDGNILKMIEYKYGQSIND